MHEMSADIKGCIQAGYPYLYLLTFEEERTRRMLASMCAGMEKQIYTWSAWNGFSGNISDPHDDPLKAINENGRPGVYLLFDFHLRMENTQVQRQLKDMRWGFSYNAQTIVITAPRMIMPPELEKQFAVFEVPLPEPDELETLWRDICDENPPKVDDIRAEHFARAARGLTLEEARLIFSRVLFEVSQGAAFDTSLVIEEKRRLVSAEQALEFYDLEFSTADVGGLNTLKKWLAERSGAFDRRAREFGLPEPKGMLLLGVQGCGKSLTAKAIASYWKLPLVRLDLGAVFSGSRAPEETLRRATRLLEAMSPVVLWIDEIEKGFAGSSDSSGEASGRRILGHFITWLQEKKRPVFVVATANRVDALPPELLRKGRFDELFFVDLPNEVERREIFEIHLKRRGVDSAKLDMKNLVDKTRNFTGSEIEQVVIDSLYRAYANSAALKQDDIEKTIEAVVPIYNTYQEDIKKLRDWASSRTRRASMDTSLTDCFVKE